MGIIFRPLITIKGHRVYAKDKGLKAFPIYVDSKATNSTDTTDV